MLQFLTCRMLPGLLSRVPRVTLRSFSSVESLTIPCRSNGVVTIEYVDKWYTSSSMLTDLSIHHPVAAPSPVPSICIYMPRGPILHNEADDASNISILRTTLSCHVVKINYRWGGEHHFPSPIHDVSAAFDWIISNLLPKRAITRAGRAERAGRIAVCGELIGGQLATALALTECKTGEPGISAAIVNNPLTDWTELVDDPEQPNQGLTTRALLKHRRALFRKKEHWFDVFASPALLFRSAGTEVPKDTSSLPFDDMNELVQLDREESFQEQLALGNASGFNAPHSPQAEEERVTKRKASRRFPSKALGLRLPSFRITTGKESPLAGQAMELAHFMRQSLERASKAASLSHELEVNQPVQYVEKPGTGLWDGTNAGRASMLESANWLARNLAR